MQSPRDAIVFHPIDESDKPQSKYDMISLRLSIAFAYVANFGSEQFVVEEKNKRSVKFSVGSKKMHDMIASELNAMNPERKSVDFRIPNAIYSLVKPAVDNYVAQSEVCATIVRTQDYKSLEEAIRG